MAEPKTRPTKQRVGDFIKAIEDPVKRQDAKVLMKLMREATGRRATMWGTSIVGFDTYSTTNSAGKTVQWMLTAFSPRKQDLTLYIMNGFSDYAALLKKLGKHKTSKSCLYIKRLDDVDIKVLEQIIKRSVRDMRKAYPDR